MKIPVIIEPLPGNRFRARSGEPLPLTAEGESRPDALKNLGLLISRHLAASKAELAELEVSGVTDNPWDLYAGVLPKDDPVVQEWLEIMQENRRKADEDPDLP
jgi:hypothetical protein